MINEACTHKTKHNHGTRTCYVVDRCRCSDCREANRVTARDRRRAKLYGEYDKFVDGDQVRAHLKHLMNQGMGWKRIAQKAGLGSSTVYPILYGKHLTNPDHPEHRPPRKQVLREVAERLLAVELDLADGAAMPSVGTIRRLQGLVALGYHQSFLAHELGMEPGNFWALMRAERVTAARHRAVCALASRLDGVEPPSGRLADRARAYATVRGWPPLAAWDEDQIDDPTAHKQANAYARRGIP